MVAFNFISKVKPMGIPIPCVDEQLKITEYLSAIDNLISKS